MSSAALPAVAVPVAQSDAKSTTASDLVEANGNVKYTIKLTSGYLQVPSGSQLALTTSMDGFTYSGPCTMPANGVVDMGTGLSFAINPNAVVTCVIEVSVTEQHQAQGKVPGFTVTAAFTGGASVTKAFYVPTISTQDVPVYTGGILGLVSSTVFTSAGNLFPGRVVYAGFNH